MNLSAFSAALLVKQGSLLCRSNLILMGCMPGKHKGSWLHDKQDC